MSTVTEEILVPTLETPELRRNLSLRLRIDTFQRTYAIPYWYTLLKTFIEWTTSLSLFVLTAPLLILLTLVVRLTSRGHPFYSQTRLGRNGRRYKIYKIRTMVRDAEGATGAVWASKDDARITPIGKILRETHLDELPQLWNVLRGDMSLIGPRPERPEISGRIEQLFPEFHLRLLVRPGITGLAQMILPADDPADPQLTGLRKKLAHDLYYIRNVSFLLDSRIFFSTACHFLASMVDALRRQLVGSHAIAVEKEMRIDERLRSAPPVCPEAAPPSVSKAA